MRSSVLAKLQFAYAVEACTKAYKDEENNDIKIIIIHLKMLHLVAKCNQPLGADHIPDQNNEK